MISEYCGQTKVCPLFKIERCEMEFKKLFSEVSIGNLKLKNRVVMEPMMLGFGQISGCPTEQMMNYYEERAKGGTGLIVTEITRVNDVTGASSFGQLAVSHDYHIEPLAEMARRIHKYGTKFMVELHHPGRQNLGLMIGTVPLSVTCEKFVPGYRKLLFDIVPFGRKLMDKDIVPPVVSPSKCEKSNFADSVNRGLSNSAVKKLVKQFIDGAERVKKAGCDGVYLHAAHGYLIQQFLSPNTNHRTDEYGGNLENRMRFLLEIISGIRSRCGNDFPIVVRLSVDEMYEKIGQKNKGYNLEEGVKIAKRLEKAGIDAIDVSSAAYDTFNYWLEPATFECGWRKYLAEAVKKEVSIPVIAANLIRTPEQAEKQLEEGSQDLIGLGRPLIADPYWCQKAENNKQNEIKHCVCCLYCFESMEAGAFEGTNGHCSVNPLVGREGTELIKNGNGRKVTVVGAGVAGLMCAEILAKRGFDVIVYEKADKVGGQVYLASQPPHKEKIYWCAKDLLINAEKAGAKVVFNTEVTAEMLENESAYAVIIATGGNAIFPKPFQKENSCTVTEILDGTVKLENKKVAVIGSGMTGLETSELLCENNNKVTIIEMADKIAPGAWFQQLDDALPKLEKAGTVFMPSSKLMEITENGVTVENTKTKVQSFVEADYVVLSLGVRPDNMLYEQLKDKVKNIYLVGDAVKTGRIAHATESAYQIATKLN